MTLQKYKTAELTAIGEAQKAITRLGQEMSIFRGMIVKEIEAAGGLVRLKKTGAVYKVNLARIALGNHSLVHLEGFKRKVNGQFSKAQNYIGILDDVSFVEEENK